MGLQTIPKSGSMLTGYTLYLPDNYDPAKKYKTIIFGHGVGEQGDGSATGLTNWFNSNVPALLDFLAKGKHILIAPQLLSSEGVWNNKYFDFAYNELKTKWNVEDKTHVTGVSLAGQIVYSWCAANQSKVANLVPCCCVFVNTNFTAINNLTRAYHSKDDATVSWHETENAINNIRSDGGPATAVYYTTGGHYIWNRVYGEPDVIAMFNDETVTPPQPIVLNADASATLKLVTASTATLNGSRSTGYKQSGNYKDMSWNLLSYPQGGTWDVFPNYNKIGEMLNVYNLVNGQYIWELTVRDSAGVADKDQVVIDVSISPPAKIIFTEITGVTLAPNQKLTVYTDKTYSIT